MLTLRIDEETKEMIAYLRNHNVKYTPVLRNSIKDELKSLCLDFKMKEKRIKNAPDWVYD